VLANEKGFTFGTEEEFWGPQVLWLQNCLVESSKDRFCISIVLPRPKNKTINLEEEIEEEGEGRKAQELFFKCTIKRPIAPSQYVNSVIQCRIGDIIILEEDKGLEIDNKKHPHGICLLLTLYRIKWQH
jgi:hypothetical protein